MMFAHGPTIVRDKVVIIKIICFNICILIKKLYTLINRTITTYYRMHGVV